MDSPIPIDDDTYFAWDLADRGDAANHPNTGNGTAIALSRVVDHPNSPLPGQIGFGQNAVWMNQTLTSSGKVCQLIGGAEAGPATDMSFWHVLEMPVISSPGYVHTMLKKNSGAAAPVDPFGTALGLINTSDGQWFGRVVTVDSGTPMAHLLIGGSGTLAHRIPAQTKVLIWQTYVGATGLFTIGIVYRSGGVTHSYIANTVTLGAGHPLSWGTGEWRSGTYGDGTAFPDMLIQNLRVDSVARTQSYFEDAYATLLDAQDSRTRRPTDTEIIHLKFNEAGLPDNVINHGSLPGDFLVYPTPNSTQGEVYWVFEEPGVFGAETSARVVAGGTRKSLVGPTTGEPLALTLYERHDRAVSSIDPFVQRHLYKLANNSFTDPYFNGLNTLGASPYTGIIQAIIKTVGQPINGVVALDRIPWGVESSIAMTYDPGTSTLAVWSGSYKLAEAVMGSSAIDWDAHGTWGMGAPQPDPFVENTVGFYYDARVLPSAKDVAWLDDTINYPLNVMTIDRVVPSSGLEGDTVAIFGSNFHVGVTAFFGGVEAVVTRISSTELSCVIGAHASGEWVDVEVLNP